MRRRSKRLGRRIRASIPCLLATLIVGMLTGAARADESSVDFQREIRPLLADACFRCHGPDEEARQAELRLDVEESAQEYAVAPGEPDESELLRRVLSTDPDERMPPPDAGEPLTAEQIDLLRRWIAEGAHYDRHWAFIAPQRSDLPEVEASGWVRNPIDAFVLARLQAEGLAPSDEADRVTLLRRLSLDLIGLPPTPDEIETFLADDEPGADERAVRRMLDSPHHGERWGRLWLDAARYADSSGYEKDLPREMWFYRDWVIQALNNDLPYDEFIVRQIAGDLLPNPTQDDLAATGFLRNSMINEEGGADPEQFRMEAMYDRIDAIGKSILGVTVQCAQCHSHKYDPLAHEEYYRLFAFLNNTHDAIISAYTASEQDERGRIAREIAAIERRLQNETPDWRERMAGWEESARGTEFDWQVLKPVKVPYEGQKFRLLDDHSILSESYAPTYSSPEFEVHTEAQGVTGFRLELLTHPNLPRGGPGRSIRGTGALTEMSIHIAPADHPEQREKIKLVAATADVNPAQAPQPDFLPKSRDNKDESRVTGPIEFALDGDSATAWTTDVDPGRRNQPRKAVFIPENPIGFPQGSVITFQPQMNHGGWNSDDNQNCLLGRYRFSLTTEQDPIADPLPARVREILRSPAEERTEDEQAAVFSYWRTTVDEWSAANAEIEALCRQHPEGTTQLVLQEREQPRVTSVLERGDFLKPLAPVEPGVPAFLHPLELDGEPPRLAFARWLVDGRSPTTARSIVNRVWQAYFGVGLVETSDDLGSQSTPPSHAELLDWLAVEFMEQGWSLKHLHTLIVTSAAYRQSSHATTEQYDHDPRNRLLARGPRFRVDAEVVRDIALSASGLLNREIGGPSVYPPAPAFLFEPPVSYGPKIWREDQGADRYRRGLYTFRFRSVPYPMLETFDAVPGEVSCVRRSRSNTPLQALTSLNEPLFMECARALAVLTLQEGGATDADRIRYAMLRCTARTPADDELATIAALLDRQRSRIVAGELDAGRIVHGEQVDQEAEAEQETDKSTADLAAWTLVARVLLNLDETITKE